MRRFRTSRRSIVFDILKHRLPWESRQTSIELSHLFHLRPLLLALLNLKRFQRLAMSTIIALTACSSANPVTPSASFANVHSRLIELVDSADPLSPNSTTSSNTCLAPPHPPVMPIVHVSTRFLLQELRSRHFHCALRTVSVVFHQPGRLQSRHVSQIVAWRPSSVPTSRPLVLLAAHYDTDARVGGEINGMWPAAAVLEVLDKHQRDATLSQPLVVTLSDLPHPRPWRYPGIPQPPQLPDNGAFSAHVRTPTTAASVPLILADTPGWLVASYSPPPRPEGLVSTPIVQSQYSQEKIAPATEPSSSLLSDSAVLRRFTDLSTLIPLGDFRHPAQVDAHSVAAFISATTRVIEQIGSSDDTRLGDGIRPLQWVPFTGVAALFLLLVFLGHWPHEKHVLLRRFRRAIQICGRERHRTKTRREEQTRIQRSVTVALEAYREEKREGANRKLEMERQLPRITARWKDAEARRDVAEIHRRKAANAVGTGGDARNLTLPTRLLSAVKRGLGLGERGEKEDATTPEVKALIEEVQAATEEAKAAEAEVRRTSADIEQARQDIRNTETEIIKTKASLGLVIATLARTKKREKTWTRLMCCAKERFKKANAVKRKQLRSAKDVLKATIMGGKVWDFTSGVVCFVVAFAIGTYVFWMIPFPLAPGDSTESASFIQLAVIGAVAFGVVVSAVVMGTAYVAVDRMSSGKLRKWSVGGDDGCAEKLLRMSLGMFVVPVLTSSLLRAIPEAGAYALGGDTVLWLSLMVTGAWSMAVWKEQLHEHLHWARRIEKCSKQWKTSKRWPPGVRSDPVIGDDGGGGARKVFVLPMSAVYVLYVVVTFSVLSPAATKMWAEMPNGSNALMGGSIVAGTVAVLFPLVILFVGSRGYREHSNNTACSDEEVKQWLEEC